MRNNGGTCPAAILYYWSLRYAGCLLNFLHSPQAFNYTNSRSDLLAEFPRQIRMRFSLIPHVHVGKEIEYY